MFWCRLRQSRHRFYAFSSEFNRSYHVTSGPIVNQYISPRTVVPILNNPKFIVQDSQLEFFHKVRFCGKRTKPLKKEKDEDQFEPRVNKQITAPYIRLVTEEGHDVVPLEKAMAQAESLGMDLVKSRRIGSIALLFVNTCQVVLIDSSPDSPTARASEASPTLSLPGLIRDLCFGQTCRKDIHFSSPQPWFLEDEGPKEY